MNEKGRPVLKREEKEAQEESARRGGSTGKKIVRGHGQLIELDYERKRKQRTVDLDRSIEEEKKVGSGGEP